MRLSPARIAAALVSLVLAGVSVYWAAAEIIAIGPRVMLGEAIASPQTAGDLDWESGYQALSLSLAIKPANASLQYDAGRVARMRAAQVAADDAAQERWLSLAQGHILAALAHRPTWGQAWAELAQVQLQQGDLAGSRTALVRAMTLEPYEGVTQQMVFWAGFGNWSSLSPDERLQLVRIARAALANRSYGYVMSPAVTFGLEAVVAILVADDVDASRLLTRLIRERDRAMAEQ